MAKKQTFGDKTAAKKAAKNSVKVIMSEKTPKTNKWRFAESMVKVPDGENFETYVDSVISGK